MYYSALFADVVNCMQTDNLELKKLVYLYLMNYAKSQPDMAIMAVNTFVRDCEDPNPLIRALAVRTMGCIRVEKITEYLCEPLRKCLKDEDPYVRKTAAICVAKLHDINSQMVEDQGFLDMLKDLLADSNPMVVANAVAAIAEIADTSTNPALAGNLHLTFQVVNKLLTALNECSEYATPPLTLHSLSFKSASFILFLNSLVSLALAIFLLVISFLKISQNFYLGTIF